MSEKDAVEVWKGVKGYEDLYQVSNLGRVKSLPHLKPLAKKIVMSKEKILTPWDNGRGYKVVSLVKGKKRKNHYLHRLVLYNFVENAEEKPEVNHKNGVISDNKLKNLEWVTRSENIKHAWDNNFYSRKKRALISRINARKLANPIYCYNRERNLTIKFKGIWEAEERGYCRREIHRCLSGKKSFYKKLEWFR